MATQRDRPRFGRPKLLGAVAGVVILLGSSASAYAGSGTLWVRLYNGPGNEGDVAYDLAVSPDGSQVFVTGYSWGVASRDDYATAAYDAATGARVWATRYNGPANDNDLATSIAVSPDGSMVFVTGLSWGGASSDDYATVAYDAATGTQLWAQRYNGPNNGEADAWSVAVPPDGSK